MSAPPANPKQRLKAMQHGRERAVRQRHREAVRKVMAYRDWLKNGSDFRTIPLELPSDADFQIARGER